jgi:hypothetical protein
VTVNGGLHRPIRVFVTGAGGQRVDSGSAVIKYPNEEKSPHKKQVEYEASCCRIGIVWRKDASAITATYLESAYSVADAILLADN